LKERWKRKRVRTGRKVTRGRRYQAEDKEEE
jgi:hypothetical protein